MYKYKFSENPYQFVKQFYDEGGIGELMYQGKKFVLQRNFFKKYYYIQNNEPSFRFNGIDIDYFYHDYNKTWINERIIEIPLIKNLLSKTDAKPNEIIELGHVLKHYYPDMDHYVIDKYEKDKGVLNEDIIDYAPEKKYKFLFSISTLEHVGWDDHPRDDEKIPLALDNIKKNILSKNGVAFFTFPFGYNDNLDKIVNEGKSFSSINVFKQVNKYNQWEETELKDVQDCSYDRPYFNANALILAKLEA